MSGQGGTGLLLPFLLRDGVVGVVRGRHRIAVANRQVLVKQPLDLPAKQDEQCRCDDAQEIHFVSKSLYILFHYPWRKVLDLV